MIFTLLISNENLQYLPKFKFNLSPFGPELTLQNYFKHTDKLYLFSLGGSDGTFDNFMRLKFEFWNVKLKKKFSLNISTEIWNQPELKFFIENQLTSSNGRKCFWFQ